MEHINVQSCRRYILTAATGDAIPMPIQCGTFTDEVAAALRQMIPNDGVEHVAVVAMDCHGKPLGWTRISSGTVDSAMLYPRDIFAWLLTIPAVRFFGIAHNHPSGDVTPSKADQTGTAVVAKTGQLFPLGMRWSAVISHEPEVWQLVDAPKTQPSDEREPELPQDPEQDPDGDSDEQGDEQGDEPGEPEDGDGGDEGEGEEGEEGEEGDSDPTSQPDNPQGEDDGYEGSSGRGTPATTATTDDVRNALKKLFGG